MRITYRPEIDGIRAIAVVAVILYHAELSFFGHQPFSGGFIGVDIFFVISGYLITSIILKEIYSTGTFSFKYFYERRIRRILPALLFVMLVSIPFAWIYLLPSSFVDFSRSILSALGFSSNFYFHFSGQAYGTETGLLKPFLHTWSLSVEEQYYILFPIVLLIIFKYLRKYLLTFLILSFVISILIAEWGSKNHPSFNFYVLPTRGWELIAGSILAFFEVKLGYRNKNNKLNLFLPSIGIILIFHSILFFEDEMYHPSFYTLSPIIGVCLVIWFSDKDEIITKILSTKIFVGTGLISYSLYIWHYPIFAFARVKETLSQYNKFEWVVLTLVLSLVSYFLIEKPARNKKIKFKRVIFPIMLSIILLLILQILIIINSGYKNRVPKIIYSSLTPPSTLLNKEFDKDFSTTSWKTISKIFNTNIEFFTSKKHNVILVGDSHASTLSYDLKRKLEDSNKGFLTSVFEGCQFILNTNRVNKKTLKVYKKCSEETQNRRFEFINKYDSSIVILFGRLTNILEEERFINTELGSEGGIMRHFIQNSSNSLKKKVDRKKHIFDSYKYTIEMLTKNGHKVIIVYPMPEVGVSVPNKIFQIAPVKLFKDKHFFKKDLMAKKLTTSYELFKARSNLSFELLDSIQGKDVYKIYPHKLFCDTLIKDRCITHDEKNIFYYDDNHPSLKGAEKINELIFNEIAKIESD